ncbi:MAG: 50S ribosomal protein L35 [Phycisphaera sp.]|nr:50S ribosomal protein L35 [Phycisphaera sp.]
MSKLKSHKGILKRIRITAKGKLKHKAAGTSHLMSAWNGKDIRSKRNAVVVHKSVAKAYEKLLHTRLIGRDQG